MKSVMTTAVDDGIVERNPCRVGGAGQDRSPERPVLSVGEVVALAKVMPERYRALVLLAAFGSLRWGELAGVERSLTELAGGGRMFGPPKPTAGRRVVVVPAVIRLRWLSTWRGSSLALPVRSCSLARPARRCGMATSGTGRGVRRWPELACPRRIS
jgi:integrase